MILLPILAGLYLLGAVGYYRTIQDELENSPDTKVYTKVFPRLWVVLSVGISLLWVPYMSYVYIKRGVARA